MLLGFSVNNVRGGRASSEGPLMAVPSMLLQPHSVLLVDDEASHRRPLAAALRRASWRVHEAEDKRDALEQLNKHRFHVLILEPNLPNVNWYGMMRALTKVGAQSEILVVTAFASRALCDEAYALGSVGVLPKPTTAADVMAAIMRRQGFSGAAARRPRPCSLAKLEWEYINQVLRDARGNVSKAARVLAVPRQTLYRKLRRYPPWR